MERGSGQIPEGQRLYQEWKAQVEADPKYQEISSEIDFEENLWYQVGNARIYSGVSQDELAQRLGVSIKYVRRIERRPYNFSTKTLNRFIKAIGSGYSLEVKVTIPQKEPDKMI